MASLQSFLINWLVLPLMGGNRLLSDAIKTEEWYSTHKTVPAEPGRALRREFNIERTDTLGMPGWRLAPKNAGSVRLLYLHGGAYVHELIGPHWDIVAGLSRRTGATVYVPLYPLAPSHTWADAAKPLLEMTRRLRAESPLGGFAMAGDSAGGGLSLSLCQVLRDKGEPLPDCLVLLSPWLDGLVDHPAQIPIASKDHMLAAPGLRWAAEQWGRGVGVEDPRISPINGSMVGMPPMMILTGTFDLLHVDAWRLRDKALRENVPLIYRSYEKMFHVWMAAPVPEARQALDEVADFIKHPHGVCLNTLTQLL